jgi:hypothetical protein
VKGWSADAAVEPQKIIGTNQSAKIFNNHFINSVDELIT